MDDQIDVETAKEAHGPTMCTLYLAHVEGGQQMATAVDSRSSTKAVVTTAVQDEITIDHGVLSHQTMIEIRSGETVLVDESDQYDLLSLHEEAK